MKEIEDFSGYIDLLSKLSINTKLRKNITEFMSSFNRSEYQNKTKKGVVCYEIAPQKEMADFICSIERLNTIRKKKRIDFFADNHLRMEGIKHNLKIKNSLLDEMGGGG